MTARSELLLRNLLLEIAARPATLESRLADVLSLRFPLDEPNLSKGVYERHLVAIRARAGRKRHPLTAWLPFVTGARRNLLAPAFAIGVVLLVILFVLLNRPHGTRNPNQFAGDNPPRRKPDIRIETPPVQPNEKQPRKEEHLANNPPIKKEERRVVTQPNRKERFVHKNPMDVPPNKRKSAPEAPRVIVRSPVGAYGKVMGEPTFRLPGETKETKVLPNQPLYAGATVQTGDMDKAEMRFSDGTTVAMDFNTKLVLPVAKAGAPRPEEITVLSGKVTVHVIHLENKDVAAIDTASRKNVPVVASNSVPFSVKTPVATAKVVGTTFSLALERDKVLKAILQVTEGKVEFFNEHGNVLAGEKTVSTATKDAKPSNPKRLKVLSRYWQDPDHEVVIASYKTIGPYTKPMFEFPAGGLRLRFRTLHDGRVFITGVVRTSPAGRAGLMAGDIVYAVKGHSLKEFGRGLGHTQPVGELITLSFTRNGQRQQISCRMAERPEGGPSPRTPVKIAKLLYDATRLAKVGESDRALKRLVALARRSPSAAVYNNIGVIYQSKDDLGSAIRNYRKAVHLDPTWWRYRFNFGVALEHIGNSKRALEELTVAYRFNRNGAATALADVWNSLGRPDRMIAVFGSEKPEETDDTELYAKADALIRMHRYANAIGVAQRIVEISPYEGEAYQYLGDAFLFAGQLGKSESAYRKGNERDSGYFANYVHLGNLLDEEKRFDEAIKEYRKAVALEPTDASGFGGLATATRALGDSKTALSYISKAITLEPGHGRWYMVLGDILSDTDGTTEAEANYKRAIQLDPESARAHCSLGRLLLRSGRITEAEVEFRTAIERCAESPHAAEPWYFLGEVHEKTNQLDKAREAYRKALTINPKSKDAADALKRLGG